MSHCTKKQCRVFLLTDVTDVTTLQHTNKPSPDAGPSPVTSCNVSKTGDVTDVTEVAEGRFFEANHES
jgi:hypothetical protein